MLTLMRLYDGRKYDHKVSSNHGPRQSRRPENNNNCPFPPARTGLNSRACSYFPSFLTYGFSFEIPLYPPLKKGDLWYPRSQGCPAVGTQGGNQRLEATCVLVDDGPHSARREGRAFRAIASTAPKLRFHAPLQD